jgi:hypothetical protein
MIAKLHCGRDVNEICDANEEIKSAKNVDEADHQGDEPWGTARPL